MNFGLLLIRVVVGLLLIGHGSQKLFGAFGGGGIVGTARTMDKLGFRPPKTMALLAGLGEFIGGLMLVTGLFSPLGAAIVIAVMLNASAAHRGNGPFVTNKGWELPLTYATVGVLIGFTGYGSYSFDNGIGWTYGGNGWGITALVLGLVLGGASLALRIANLQDAKQGNTPPA